MKRGYLLLKKLTGFVFAAFLATGIAADQNERPSAMPEMNDLDEFMAKVMQKRNADAENLRDYLFSERERLDIREGQKISALWSFRREHVWFVRDDYLVRSPVLIDGVKVSAGEQTEAEEEWIKSQKRRKEKNNETSLDHATFFGFKFEPGRYLYAGEQEFEGRNSIVVEYYPRMNSESRNNKPDRNKRTICIGICDDGSDGGLFEKTFLVTMLISPEEYQILKITFDNVGLEFLPLRSLARMNDIKASMIMDKPKGDIWLPREISAYGSASTANMDLSINYSREFHSYAKSDVKVKLWFDIHPTESEK